MQLRKERQNRIKSTDKRQNMLPHITANYYTCTDEILAGLGKMYVADERFNKNIDKYGEENAEFVAEGIRIYVENK